MATTTHDAMYRSVGGDAGLTVLVDNFYTRLWNDPSLNRYFEGIDRDSLKRHQRMFLTFALGGGPDTYDGKPLSAAHTGLNITNEAFDTVAYHLRLTLEELDIDRPLISIIMGFVEGARPQVVMRSGF
ncbi:MAG: hemoglobin [Solirubrobacteraceae bacterium]|nr:hemoglobin [Solirubrobacteraceae bacterium]